MRVKLSDVTKYLKGTQINGDDLIENGEYIYLTHASIPEVSKIVISARDGLSFWQIGSVRSTRRSKIDCKSDKKSCLNRVNLEASGTTSNPQKSRNS